MTNPEEPVESEEVQIEGEVADQTPPVGERPIALGDQMFAKQESIHAGKVALVAAFGKDPVDEVEVARIRAELSQDRLSMKGLRRTLRGVTTSKHALPPAISWYS